MAVTELTSLRNDSFLGEKIKIRHLCFQSIKICSQVPFLLFLFWPCADLNSANPNLVIPENSPRSLWLPSPLGVFFNTSTDFSSCSLTQSGLLQLPPKFAFQVSLLVIQNATSSSCFVLIKLECKTSETEALFS